MSPDLISKLQKYIFKNSLKIWIISTSFITFLLSFWLISRNNGFYSGDMAINGLIVQDLRAGKFYSWYFYGQSYFGNLEHFVLVFTTFFTGISIKSLYFWEHFFYFISVTLLLSNLKNLKYWQAPVFSLIFFFSTRYFGYLYYPQGFAFVLLICISFFVLFKNIDSGNIKFSFWTSALVGLFSSLSLWHNPTYVIILPIYFVLVFRSFWKLGNKDKFKQFLVFSLAFLVGLVPLYLGASETNYDNLRWFLSSGSGGKKDLFASVVYLAKDFTLYYTNTSSLVFDKTTALLSSILQSFQNLWGVLISTTLFITLLLAFKNFKEYRVNALFTGFLLTILVIRGGVGAQVFEFVRYAIPFYTIVLFTFFEYFSNFKPALDLKSRLLKTCLSATVLSLLIFSMTSFSTLYFTANLGNQFYTKIIDKIKQNQVKYIYCDNFYDACATIAFLGGKDNIQVQLIPSDNSNINRNPADIGETDAAVQRGEKVMSIIYATRLKPTQTIIEEFKFSEQYYLIEGDYNQ